MAERPSLHVETEEVLDLTLTDLCHTCDLTVETIIELVDQGILSPKGADTAAWRFESTSIITVRKTQRLQRDLGVNLPGVALVLNLVDEKARLQARLQRLEEFVLGETEDSDEPLKAPDRD